MQENTKALIEEIKKNLSQTSASQKDEVRVMKAMLNDKDYVIDLYSNEGKVGTYCPSRDARDMISLGRKLSSRQQCLLEKFRLFALILCNQGNLETLY